MNKITITLPNGRVNHIGDYHKEKNTLVLPKKRSIHFMHKYKGWGIDRKVLEYFATINSKIAILDTENNKRYETEATYFKENGIVNIFHNQREEVFMNEKQFTIGNIN